MRRIKRRLLAARLAWVEGGVAADWEAGVGDGWR
jgi:hypothetical protein